jgi:hypothetical protein
MLVSVVAEPCMHSQHGQPENHQPIMPPPCLFDHIAARCVEAGSAQTIPSTPAVTVCACLRHLAAFYKLYAGVAAGCVKRGSPQARPVAPSVTVYPLQKESCHSEQALLRPLRCVSHPAPLFLNCM